MEKTLRVICKLPGCEGLVAVAGKGGLDAEVKWTAVIDSLELIQFSNEGDLNFVTGVGLHNDDEILALTKEAFNYNMAGIVFAPGGPYIKNIPEHVLEFADKHDFPILTIPWESKISNYARIIGKFIIDETYPERSLIDVLKAILTGKEVLPFEVQVINQLSRQGINQYDKYRVALIHIVQKEAEEKHKFKDVYSSTLREINDTFFSSAYIVPMKFGAALIFSGSEAVGKPDMQFSTKMIDQLQQMYHDYEFRLGFGLTYNQIEKLSISYNEAALVVNLVNSKSQEEKNIYEYENLGAYRVIWEGKNQKCAMDFSEKMLGALETYDKINESDLMHCLRTYIEQDCSVKEVSQRLYLHKNTVLYKLKKIESILNCTFSKREDLFNLQFALMIKDVFERKGQ